MTTTAWVILVVAIIVAAGVVSYVLRQQRSRKLRSHFGQEYDRTVRELGSRPRAEAALLARQRRVKKVHIHPLSNDERERFAQLWHDVQSRFVDDPSDSIREADRLVSEAMLARGYPMSDFEHRAEDLSVSYPEVVRNFRAAHGTATRHERGEASTEDLRKALVYYRELFDELLEANTTGTRETRR